MKTLLIALTLILSANAAQAMTGNQFLTYLEPFRFPYITGLADMTEANGDTCVPNHVTYGQLEKIVDQFLAAHSEKLHMEMPALYIMAIYKAFDCKINPTKN